MLHILSTMLMILVGCLLGVLMLRLDPVHGPWMAADGTETVTVIHYYLPCFFRLHRTIFRKQKDPIMLSALKPPAYSAMSTYPIYKSPVAATGNPNDVYLLS